MKHKKTQNNNFIKQFLFFAQEKGILRILLWGPRLSLSGSVCGWHLCPQMFTSIYLPQNCRSLA